MCHNLLSLLILSSAVDKKVKLKHSFFPRFSGGNAETFTVKLCLCIPILFNPVTHSWYINFLRPLHPVEAKMIQIKTHYCKCKVSINISVSIVPRFSLSVICFMTPRSSWKASEADLYPAVQVWRLCAPWNYGKLCLKYTKLFFSTKLRLEILYLCQKWWNDRITASGWI